MNPLTDRFIFSVRSKATDRAIINSGPHLELRLKAQDTMNDEFDLDAINVRRIIGPASIVNTANMISWQLQVFRLPWPIRPTYSNVFNFISEFSHEGKV